MHKRQCEIHGQQWRTSGISSAKRRPASETGTICAQSLHTRHSRRRGQTRHAAHVDRRGVASNVQRTQIFANGFFFFCFFFFFFFFFFRLISDRFALRSTCSKKPAADKSPEILLQVSVRATTSLVSSASGLSIASISSIGSASSAGSSFSAASASSTSQAVRSHCICTRIVAHAGNYCVHVSRQSSFHCSTCQFADGRRSRRSLLAAVTRDDIASCFQGDLSQSRACSPRRPIAPATLRCIWPAGGEEEVLCALLRCDSGRRQRAQSQTNNTPLHYFVQNYSSPAYQVPWQLFLRARRQPQCAQPPGRDAAAQGVPESGAAPHHGRSAADAEQCRNRRLHRPGRPRDALRRAPAPAGPGAARCWRTAPASRPSSAS
jgi:hypothetical protein